MKKGFLLIAAIILVIIVGAMGVYVGFVSTSGSESSTLYSQHESAENIALAGLYDAANHVIESGSINSTSCDGLNAELGQVNFGRGQFEATGDSTENPAVCKLTSTGVVPNFDNAVAKHVMTGIVSRKSENWIVGDRSSSTSVMTILRNQGVGWESGGYTYSGGTPNFETITAFSGNEMWAAGPKMKNAAGVEVLNLWQWTGSSWRLATHAASPENPNGNGLLADSINTTATINSIYCVSSNDCWAVGNYRLFLHYTGDPAQWTYSASYLQTSGTYNIKRTTNFKSVSCVTADYCWAVGEPLDSRPLIAFWNGTKWKRLAKKLGAASDYPPYHYNKNVPAATLNAVTCVAIDDCWAVGNKQGKKLNIDKLVGNEWRRVNSTSPKIDKNLLGLKCLTSTDCWAVGGPDGSLNTVMHYTGGTWTRVSMPSGLPVQVLNAIDCASADSCYAVGDNGAVLHYSDGTWSGVIPVLSDLRTSDLKGVVTLSEGSLVLSDIRDQ